MSPSTAFFVLIAEVAAYKIPRWVCGRGLVDRRTISSHIFLRGKGAEDETGVYTWLGRVQHYFLLSDEALPQFQGLGSPRSSGWEAMQQHRGLRRVGTGLHYCASLQGRDSLWSLHGRGHCPAVRPHVPRRNPGSHPLGHRRPATGRPPVPAPGQRRREGLGAMA